MFVILLLALLMQSQVRAEVEQGFRLIQLDELSVTARSYMDYSRYHIITDNGLPNKVLEKEFQISIKTTLFEYMYWDNLILSHTDRDRISGYGQFRTVGYQSRLGLRLSRYVDLGIHHFSQHVLDYTGNQAFPMMDALEIKIYLYRRTAQEALLP
jgi:hypothetical protein